jgi:uncharacterized protein involved in outer membrane biogenesis
VTENINPQTSDSAHQPEDPEPAATGESEAASRGAQETGESAEGTKKGCVSRLRVWLWRLLIALLLIVGGGRLALPYALPHIIPEVLGKFDLKLEYDSLELSTLCNFVELKNISVRSVDNKKDYLSIGRFTFHLKLRPLLSKQIYVKQLDIQGARLTVDRDSDGHFELIKRLKAAIDKLKRDRQDEPREDKKSTAKPWRAVTHLPVKIFIESLEISRFTLAFRDDSVEPAFQSDLKVHLTAAKLGLPTDEGVAHIDLTLSLLPVIKELSFHAQTSLNGEDNRFHWTVKAASIDIDKARQYLDPIRSQQKKLSLSAAGSLSTEAAPGYPDSLKATVRVNDLQLKAEADEQLALDRLEIHITALNLSELIIGEIKLTGVRASAVRTASGDIEVAGLLLPTAKKQRKNAGQQPSLAREVKEQPKAPLDYRFLVNLLAVSGLDLKFEDKTTKPGLSVQLQSHEILIRDFILDKAEQQRPSLVTARLKAPGIAQSIFIDGQVTLFSKRKTVKVTVKVDGIKPAALKPYLEKAHIESEIKAGKLQFQVSAMASSQRAGAQSSFQLTKLRFSDGEQLLALDSCQLENLRSAPTGLNIRADTVSVQGFRGRLERDSNGDLLCCHLRFKKPGEAAQNKDSRGKKEALTKVNKNEKTRIELSHLKLGQINVSFYDRSSKRPLDLSLKDMGLQFDELLFNLDPKANSKEATLNFSTRVPGLLDQLTARGVITPSLKSPNISLTITGQGFKPTALAGVFKRHHIKSQLNNGWFKIVAGASAELQEERIQGNLTVDRAELKDGAATLFLLRDVKLAGLNVELRNKEAKSVSVDLIEIPTLQAALTLSKDSLDFCGLRRSLKPEKSSPAPKQRALVKAPKRALPDFALKKLKIGQIAVQLTDDFGPSGRVTPLTLTADLGPLLFNNTKEEGASKTPYSITVRAPGVWDKLALSGSFAGDLRGLKLNAHLDLTGLTASSLRAHLAKHSIRPQLKSGRLKLDIISALALDNKTASVQINQASFHDGPLEHWGWDQMKIDQFQWGQKSKRVFKLLKVTRPRLRLARLKSGSLSLSGLIIDPAPSKPGSQKKGARSLSEDGEPRVKMAGVVMNKVRIDDFDIIWRDAVPEAAVAVRSHGTIKVDRFVFGRKASAAKFDITVKVDDAIKKLTMTGSFKPDPKDIQLSLDLAIQNLRVGPLKPYIPPALKLTLKNASLKTHIDARFTSHKRASYGAKLQFKTLKYADGQEPLLSLDDLTVNAPRLDSEVIAVEKISVTGLESTMVQTKEGLLRVLGLELGHKAKKQEADRETKPKSAAKSLKSAPFLPYMRVDQLVIKLRKFNFTRRGNDKSRTFTVNNLSFMSEGRLEAFGKTPEKCQAMKLRLKSEVQPLFKELDMGISLAPCSLDPELSLDIKVRGIESKKWASLIPGINRVGRAQLKIEEDGIERGHFSMKLAALFRLNRQSATDFNISRAFGAELALSDMVFRDGGSGELLAGLDKILIDISKMKLSGGDIFIRQIEVIKPRALIRVDCDKQRIEALGLKIWLPKQSQKRDRREAKNTVQEKPGNWVSGGPKESRAELRIDRFLLTDIDIKIQDKTTTPPFIIPFDNIDLALYNLTTRAFEQRRSIRYELNMALGRAPLLKRPELSKIPGYNFFAELVRGATEMTGFGERRLIVNERSVLEELTAKGRFTLFPSLSHFSIVEISAFELLSLAGPAIEQGVLINDGLLDAKLVINYQEDQALSVNTLIKLESVDINEGDSGPIREYLKLKFPTKLVVFALRDEEGVIKIPWSLDLPKGDLSSSNIQESLILLFGRLVGQATGKAIFRVLGTVTKLGQLTLGQIPGLDKVPGLEFIPFLRPDAAEFKFIYLDFEPAELSLDEAMSVRLEALAGRLKSQPELKVILIHELGMADYARLAQTTDPGAEDCRGLITRFRGQRDAFVAQRRAIKANIRSAHRGGLESKGRSLRTDLRRLDSKIAALNSRIARVCELLMPRARRGAERRRQKGARELGAMRLQYLFKRLRALGVEKPRERIRLGRVRYEKPKLIGGGQVKIVLSVQRN